jgi:3-oxoacyl-[acyl-carrier protein] reductase
MFLGYEQGMVASDLRQSVEQHPRLASAYARERASANTSLSRDEPQLVVGVRLAIERMRERVEEELGIVEVLVAFAASGGPLPGPTAQITEEEWRSAINGNLTSAFLTLKSFLPGMVERGSGSIVTMASSTGRVPTQAPTAYAAAEAGVVMLSRQVAVEVARHGVRVNCLAPDSILTERTRSYMSEDQLRQWTAMFPLGRMGSPEDVAQTTLFLTSASSSWLTGATLDVAGGKIML